MQIIFNVIILTYKITKDQLKVILKTVVLKAVVLSFQANF